MSETKLYTCGFLVDDEDHVLLIRKNRPAFQKGRLNGIGGKLEPGETPIQAMAREFREETGLDISEANWREFAVLHIDANETPSVVHFYVTRGSLDGHRTMTDEELVVVDAHALPDECLWNLRWLIPLALDASIKDTVHIRS